MKNWATSFLKRIKIIIEKQVPVGELTDENYVIYFRQVFILVSSILGFILCTLSLYTQKDTGALNILGLLVIDTILVINFFLVRKQKEKIAAYLLGVGLLTGFTLGILDDYHFLSKGFIWFLITPFVMFAILDVKDFFKILFLNLFIFAALQLFFYPEATQRLPLHGGIDATKYWVFINVEYITAFMTVLIMIATYWYANYFLSKRFKRFREKFSQTAKLTALGEMAGNIGHEINNPLAVIKVSSDSLKKNLEKDIINKDRMLDNIQIIDKTIKRISKIINSLKMISRQENDNSEVINPSEIIDKVIPISNIHINMDRVKFEKKLSYGLRVKGSSVQLSQIILNLLNNALYAVKKVKSPLIEIKCFELYQLIIIQIIDNGSGVAENIIDKIFEPFFTSKPIGEGTGLGLSLCRSMAHQMGGDIEYKRENHLSIFELSLPVLS